QACTFTELYGVPAIAADLERPPIAGGGAYLEEPRSLLSVTAETLLSVGEGQAVEQCKILELCDRGGRSYTENLELTQAAEFFCMLLRSEVDRKNEVADWDKRLGRAGALQCLAGSQPVNVYTLKQFPDAGRPQQACYQALVKIPYVIDEIHQIEEIPRLMCVKIAQRPSFPLVQMLGLATRDVVEGDGSSVFIVEAVRPFFMRVGLSLRNGEHLQYRAGMTWVSTEASEQTGADDVDPSVLSEVEEQLSTGNPCYIRRIVRAWLE